VADCNTHQCTPLTRRDVKKLSKISSAAPRRLGPFCRPFAGRFACPHQVAKKAPPLRSKHCTVAGAAGARSGSQNSTPENIIFNFMPYWPERNLRAQAALSCAPGHLPLERGSCRFRPVSYAKKTSKLLIIRPNCSLIRKSRFARRSSFFYQGRKKGLLAETKMKCRKLFFVIRIYNRRAYPGLTTGLPDLFAVSPTNNLTCSLCPNLNSYLNQSNSELIKPRLI